LVVDFTDALDLRVGKLVELVEEVYSRGRHKDPPSGSSPISALGVARGRTVRSRSARVSSGRHGMMIVAYPGPMILPSASETHSGSGDGSPVTRTRGRSLPRKATSVRRATHS
jgi:hypothetical protein